MEASLSKKKSYGTYKLEMHLYTYTLCIYTKNCARLQTKITPQSSPLPGGNNLWYFIIPKTASSNPLII